MTAFPFKITIVPVTPFQQNCMLIVCTQTNACAVIDPGGDIPLIVEAVKASGGKIEKIVLTHGHIDHAGGARELADQLGCPIVGPHKDDQFLLDELADIGLQYGAPGAKSFTPDLYLDEGDKVTVGDLTFTVRHIPGHTPGHIVLVDDQHRFVVSGDTVFAGSIGRTDFQPYGNHGQLIKAIEEKLLALADDYTLLPGHGGATTVGQEKRTNPFLLEARRA